MTCLSCGGPVTQKGVGRPRKYCEACSPGRRGKSPTILPSACAHCGTSLGGQRSRYCSPRCKDLARRVPCADCGKPTGIYRRQADDGEHRCRECQRESWRHGTRRGYREAGCRCEECRRWGRIAQASYAAAFKAREGIHPSKAYRVVGDEQRFIAWSERKAIYDRDGWICQICAEPVDRALLGSADPMGPSLDHIIPRSRMSAPDHSPRNLRLAHRLCNTKRGTSERLSSSVVG